MDPQTGQARIVRTPDGVTHRFPAEATDAQIAEALGGSQAPRQATTQAQTSDTLKDALDTYTNAPTPENREKLLQAHMNPPTPEGMLSRTVKRAGESLAAPVLSPLETLKGVLTLPYRLAHMQFVDQPAKVAASKAVGDTLHANLHELARWVPFAGPVIDEYVTRIANGEGPEVAGEAIAGIVGSKLPTGGGKIPVSPALKNPNSVTAAAADWGAAKGIPVDAATATGNDFVRGTQYLADRSLLGSVVSSKARAATGKALGAAGDDLAAQVHPTAVSPEQAGVAVRSGLSKVIEQHAADADVAYGDLRKLEADPRNARQVQVGTKTTTSKVLDAKGNPITTTEPVMETIALPVDLKATKAALKPVYEKLLQQTPVAQQRASPALHAMQHILEGPDMSPLSVVDTDLSALKGLARGADLPELKNVAQGTASYVVSNLESAVQRAAGSAPSGGVLDALKAGRKATESKYLVSDVLNKVRDEPVQAFNQTTWAKDAGIDQLRSVAKVDPTIMPKIGRAYIDDMLTQATAAGGFEKAGQLFNQWQNLGPETKTLIFRNPALVQELDKFFALSKRLAETPNPSGTAGVLSIGSQAAAAIADPISSLVTQAGAGVLSKAFHNPAFVRALTNGLSIPVSAKAARAAQAAVLAAQLKNMAPEK